ncbi:MAG: hypothetical protein HY360_03320 [Verrucomicrobia bacterium]|nr:hypothetical protein [Verrucomicrobiota bacterium]
MTSGHLWKPFEKSAAKRYPAVVIPRESTLGERLGMSVHVSPLHFKLRALRERYSSRGAERLEDWLVDVANARGARIVVRTGERSASFTPPPANELSNEELVVGICLLQCLDRPQMLRLAAQLISRRAVAFPGLRLAARRERVGVVLGELARQSLCVSPSHELWRQVAEAFPPPKNLRSPVLHWTRLAEPVMKDGRCNADGWRLVA